MELKVTKVTVTEVIHGNTFKVTPHWMSRDNIDGDTVMINGYNTPEKGQSGYQEAIETLKTLILGKEIELTNPTETAQGRLMCDVNMEGKNLTSMVPH